MKSMKDKIPIIKYLAIIRVFMKFRQNLNTKR